MNVVPNKITYYKNNNSGNNDNEIIVHYEFPYLLIDTNEAVKTLPSGYTEISYEDLPSKYKIVSSEENTNDDENWEMKYDKNVKAYYYYNKNTGEASWIHPLHLNDRDSEHIKQNSLQSPTNTSNANEKKNHSVIPQHGGKKKRCPRGTRRNKRTGRCKKRKSLRVSSLKSNRINMGRDIPARRVNPVYLDNLLNSLKSSIEPTTFATLKVAYPTLLKLKPNPHYISEFSGRPIIDVDKMVEDRVYGFLKYGTDDVNYFFRDDDKYWTDT